MDARALQCRIDRVLAPFPTPEGDVAPGWGRVARYWNRHRDRDKALQAPERATVHGGVGVEMPIQDLFGPRGVRHGEGLIVRFAHGSVRFAVVAISAFLGGK